MVAGDTFADALAAASLSDPTDRARGPQLRRVAAADPGFDVPGQLDRVENAFAPVVVTESGRAGATALAPSARITAADLARGGCATAREAVIVGGTVAVPVRVEAELLSLGYDEVFRVGGVDRYETAARVAAALGTQAPAAGTGCVDPDATDGRTELGFYGVAVAEYRSDPRSCVLLSKAVVLADGGTGADALAAGWWTARWQVPVLLTAPDGSLPPATSAALGELDIDSVIVLGGLDRIPEASVDRAKDLATAVAGRIAGPDRYATSIEMAQAFGGWWATQDGRSFADDLVCVAASSGSGTASMGWPDALAAGPWCARLAESGVGSPERLLPAVRDAGPLDVTGGMLPSHRAAPILLVPAGGSLPASVRSRLRDYFEPAAPWCTSERSDPTCVGPGFVTIVGGANAVPQQTVDELADIVAGSAGLARGDRNPQLREVFRTSLDLTPLYDVAGVGSHSVCADSDSMADVRWLNLSSAADRTGFRTEIDLAGASGGRAGACLRTDTTPFTATGVSLSGAVTAPVSFRGDDPAISLSGRIRQSAPAPDQPGTWRFDGAPGEPVTLTADGARGAVDGASLDLRLTPTGEATATFTASGSVSAGPRRISFLAEGAARLVSGRWQLASRVSVTSTGGPRVGAFRASLDDAGETATVEWQLDGWSMP